MSEHLRVCGSHRRSFVKGAVPGGPWWMSSPQSPCPPLWRRVIRAPFHHSSFLFLFPIFSVDFLSYHTLFFVLFCCIVVPLFLLENPLGARDVDRLSFFVTPLTVFLSTLAFLSFFSCLRFDNTSSHTTPHLILPPRIPLEQKLPGHCRKRHCLTAAPSQHSSQNTNSALALTFSIGAPASQRAHSIPVRGTGLTLSSAASWKTRLVQRDRRLG